MQIPRTKSTLIIVASGIILLTFTISSIAFAFFKNKVEKPLTAGISVVSTPTPTDTPTPTPTPTTPTPTPTLIPKLESKKPVPTPTLTPTPTQTTQPKTDTTSTAAKEASCKAEAEARKYVWTNEAYAKIRAEHPELYDYQAAVAKDPGEFSSQIDPEGAYQHWVSISKILRSTYEGDVPRTADTLYFAYYAECLNR